MKKLIIVTMIAACVALCAAVWPHGNAVEETPVPAAENAVSAKEATVAEIGGARISFIIIRNATTNCPGLASL